MKCMLIVATYLFSIAAFAQKTILKNTSVPGCGPVYEKNKKLQVENKIKKGVKNVLGTDLQIAGTNPLTGFYRDGFCSTGKDDRGVHVIAAKLTDAFLQFSKQHGNDLITPMPQYNFPGLKAEDCWCLCANRWKEAYNAGVAPPVILEATHERALDFATLAELKHLKKP